MSIQTTSETGRLLGGAPARRPCRPRQVTCAVAGVAAALALALAGVALAQRAQYATRGRGAVSLVLVADPGDLVGVSERAYLEAQMRARGEAAVSAPAWARKALCPSVLVGSLHGEAVLLVTTGIGHDRAALCLADVLRFLGPKHVRDAVFLGTAGFSPAVGGVLDSAACAADAGAPAPAPPRPAIAIGDVCVAPIATNWDCHRCEWATPATVSQCDAAPCHLHHRWDLFGSFGCTYNTAPDLADELLGAARAGSPLPAAPARLRALAGRYWAAMRDGTGVAHAPRAAPAVFGYGECAEATSNTFWAGAPFDELSRKYVATAVNAYPWNRGGADNRSYRDVVAASAMEGVGWMGLMALREVFLEATPIPSVNVRGAADYTHKPLRRERVAAGLAGGDPSLPPSGLRWVEHDDYLTDSEQANFTAEGYRFAIETTSHVVLELFAQRAAARQRARFARP